MNDFFAMGGYAAFVWPAYAVASLSLIGITVLSVRGLRKARRTYARFSGKE